MIASTPVRLVSLMILAAVIVVGIRGIFSGIALGGDLGGNLLDDHSHGGRDTGPSAPGPGSTAPNTPISSSGCRAISSPKSIAPAWRSASKRASRCSTIA